MLNSFVSFSCDVSFISTDIPLKYTIDISPVLDLTNFTVHLNKWSRFARRCTWCAVETSETTGGSKELPIRWGANTSTKVLPPQIRRGIRGSPEVQLFRQLQSCSIKIRAVRVKDNSSQSSAVLWSWHGRQRFQRGVCRVYLHFASRNYCPCIRSSARARNPHHSGMRRTDEARKSGCRLAYRVSLTYRTLF